MNELYSIMNDLLMVEYNQQSLLWLITAAEAICSGEEQTEGKYNILRMVQSVI